MVQWFNPLMPYRHINPRMSGMITFKGGGGGGDATAANQQSIADTTSDTNQKVTDGFAAAELTGNQVLGNQNDLKSGQQNLASGQQDIRADIRNIPQATVVSQTVDTSGIENRIGSLEGTTQTGFDRVDAGIGNLQGDVRGVGQAVDTGFANVGNQLGGIETSVVDTGNRIVDLQNNVGEQFSDLNNNMYGGFMATNENVARGFGDQNELLTNQFTNVLGGQANINSVLDQLGQRQDTYYGGLSQGQADIMGNLGGLQNTFSDFRNVYDDNTSLDRSAQADLQKTVVGGFNQVRDTVATSADAQARDIAQVQNAVQDQTRTQQDQVDQTAQFGQTLREITAGIPAMTQEQAAAREDVTARLDAVRQVLNAQGDNLDPAIADQYRKLANSFDQQGRLIRQSVDDQGNVIQRDINAQSNLLLATFSQSGQMLGQDALNMNQLFAAMDRLGYTGTGQPSGALSPQILVNRPAAVQSGIMAPQAPFFQTMS